jgi:hypothetical protein
MEASTPVYVSAEDHLGRCGRVLSGAKIGPSEIVWNANVCTKRHGKIWYGDLNIETQADALRALALEIGESVYVLREHDGRFKNEAKPLFDKAVATFAVAA